MDDSYLLDAVSTNGYLAIIVFIVIRLSSLIPKINKILDALEDYIRAKIKE